MLKVSYKSEGSFGKFAMENVENVLFLGVLVSEHL